MRRILTIEDNQEIRENIAELLSLEGYRVLTAANGKEGVETAHREIPDLVICDISMPELDGYGVLKELRENELTARIPIIFLTAHAEKTEIRRGLSEGALAYLVKPFTDRQLMDAISSGLEKIA